MDTISLIFIIASVLVVILGIIIVFKKFRRKKKNTRKKNVDLNGKAEKEKHFRHESEEEQFVTLYDMNKSDDAPFSSILETPDDETDKQHASFLQTSQLDDSQYKEQQKDIINDDEKEIEREDESIKRWAEITRQQQREITDSSSSSED